MKHLSVMAIVVFVLALGLSACGTLTDEGLVFKTADPKLSIGFRLHQAPPLPTVEPSLVPTVTPTPECLIKGNLSSSGEKIYHVPGSAAYDRTQIDPARGEEWLCSEDEAVEKGYRKASR